MATLPEIPEIDAIVIFLNVEAPFSLTSNEACFGSLITHYRAGTQISVAYSTQRKVA
jgi:hypothetical protein